MRSVAAITLAWLALCRPVEAQASRAVSRFINLVFAEWAASESAAVLAERAFARSAVIAEERAGVARWGSDVWTAEKRPRASAAVFERFARQASTGGAHFRVEGSHIESESAGAGTAFRGALFSTGRFAQTAESPSAADERARASSLVHTSAGTLILPVGADKAARFETDDTCRAESLLDLVCARNVVFEDFLGSSSGARDRAAAVTRRVRWFLSECGLDLAQEEAVLASMVTLSADDLRKRDASGLAHKAWVLMGASRLPNDLREETVRAFGRLALAPTRKTWETAALALEFDSALATARNSFEEGRIELAERHLAIALRKGRSLDEVPPTGTETRACREPNCAVSRSSVISPFEAVEQPFFRMRIQAYPEESVAHALLHSPKGAARVQDWNALVAKRGRYPRPAITRVDAIDTASAVLKGVGIGRRSVGQPRLLALAKEGITTRAQLQGALARWRKGKLAPLSDKAYDDLRERTIEAVRGALRNTLDEGSREALRVVLNGARLVSEPTRIDACSLQRALDEVADALEYYLSAVDLASESSRVA